MTVPLAITVASTFDKPSAIVPVDVIGLPESTSIPSEPEIATEVTLPVPAEEGVQAEVPESHASDSPSAGAVDATDRPCNPSTTTAPVLSIDASPLICLLSHESLPS